MDKRISGKVRTTFSDEELIAELRLKCQSVVVGGSKTFRNMLLAAADRIEQLRSVAYPAPKTLTKPPVVTKKMQTLIKKLEIL